MATHWWIGGSGTWNSFNVNNWSTTGSGGPPGTSIPGSGDDVVFDTGSGATNFVVTVDSFSSCNTMTVSITTVGRITFAAPSASGSTLFVYGNLSFTAQTLFDSALPLTISQYGSSGSFTINTNNARIPTLLLGQLVGTQTYTLSSALTVGTLQILSATFNTANFAITATTQSTSSISCGIQATAGGTTTLTFGSSVINIGASASETVGSYALFEINPNGPTTVTANTATITVGSTSTTNWNDADFYGGGFTYATVVLNGRKSVISGTNTFATRFTKNASLNNSYLKVFENQNFSSGAILQLIGTISSRLLVFSSTAGAQATFSGVATGTRTLSFVSFMDIALSFGSNISGTSVGNMLNNSGINFDVPRTLYLVLGSSTKNFSDSSGTNPWSLNPVGIPVGAAPPLPQDTVIFNATSGSGTLVLDTLYLGIINTTGFAGTVSQATISSNVYGDIYVLQQPTDPVGVINSIANSNIVYRFDSNITLPSLPGSVSFFINGVSARATLGANTTLIFSLTILSGEFSTSALNYSLNCGQLSTFYSPFAASAIQASTSVTRNVFLNSSYVTLTDIVPLILTFSNLSAGSSTIEVITSSGASVTFSNISGQTFNILKLTKTSTVTDFTYNGLNGATFNSIIVSPHTGLIKINLTTGTTTTVNSLTTGASRGNGIIIGANLTTTGTVTTNATLAIGSNIVTEYVAFLGITKSGASVLAARGAADLGANVGISFDPHVAVAFSGAGATSFVVPENFTGSSYFLILGAGGGAGKRSTSTAAAGGGGGGAVVVASNLNVSRGQTIFLNAPTGGVGATASGSGGSPANAWINIVANSQPTLTTNGAYADSGNGSTSGSVTGGLGGQSSNSFGHLAYSAGSGNSASSSGGGGGSVGSLIFRVGRLGGAGGTSGGSGGASIQNIGVVGGATLGGSGGAVSPNPGGAGGTGGASPQPGGSGVAGSSVGGGGGGASNIGGVNSGAGGAGATGSQWTYRSLNGVISTGTIGYGGAGGSGGGVTSTAFSNSIGGRGGDGANGSGGGGGGRGSTTGGGTGNGGNGGDALVLFVYVESRGLTFGTIIG